MSNECLLQIKNILMRIFRFLSLIFFANYMTLRIFYSLAFIRYNIFFNITILTMTLLTFDLARDLFLSRKL